MNRYKQPEEIFEKREGDKTYELGLYHFMTSAYETMKIYAKDVDEARRLANFWLSDIGRRKEGWQVKYVLPVR